jgi:hypothetical protein
MTWHITDRAADEAARILSISRAEARPLLAQWAESCVKGQRPVPQDNGLLPYRGPKPQRLQLLVTTEGELVHVRASRDTQAWLARDGRASPTGGRRQGPVPVETPPMFQVRVTEAQRDRVNRRAQARGITPSDVIRALIDAMSD